MAETIDPDEMLRRMHEIEDKLNKEGEVLTTPRSLPAESDHYIVTDYERDKKDVKRIVSFRQKTKDSGIIIDYVLQEDNRYKAVSVEWPDGQTDSLHEDVKTQTETGDSN